MHLVKLGVNKGVRTWDPQGCVWVRKSTRVMSCIGNMQETKYPQPCVEKHRDNVPSVSSLTPKTALPPVHMTDVLNSCNMEGSQLGSPSVPPGWPGWVSDCCEDTPCIGGPPESSNPTTNAFIDGI